ncbi:hypothetical protein ABZ763_22645 [Streptomyces bacillaris]|uniref:hypothetical protein n=1 Tax=Streptomyces bacillaris TaxID=68179 RepID=UPI003461264A
MSGVDGCTGVAGGEGRGGGRGGAQQQYGEREGGHRLVSGPYLAPPAVLPSHATPSATAVATVQPMS